uniref:Uncharacterized protein n=1 Tax=Anguilla anguilla TaxID=7936 RepID=A0A0E9VYY8_ANGAN
MGGILCIIHNVSGIVCLVYFVLYVRFADRFVFDAPECLKMLPYVMRTVCVLKRSRHVFHCICCPYSSCIVAQGDASNKM